MKFKTSSVLNPKETDIKEKLKNSYITLQGPDGKILGTREGDNPRICSDDSGGAIIAWDDGLIYAQRINSSGDLQWIDSGIPISQSLSVIASPDICKDDNGGAIVTWHGGDAYPEYDIYVQKVNATGHLQWDTNSIPICAASGTQATPRICSDGSGGAIVVWRDYRGWPDASNSPCDVYVQRVNSTGDIQWAQDGVLISDTNSQMNSGLRYPSIINDGEGGAFVVWEDQYDIYAQKINSSGDIQWDSNGMPICEAIGYQMYPVMCIDGLGGAFFSWNDDRNWDSTEYDIYAQWVNSSGDIQWGLDGIPIIRKNYDQKDVQICSDENGNGVIIWNDYENDKICAQKIDSKGTLLWKQEGVELGSRGSSQEVEICYDDAGGFFVAWRLGGVLTQHIDSMGNINWYGGGLTASNSMTKDLRLCSNELGGGILAWGNLTSSYKICTQIILNQDNKPISNHPENITKYKASSEFINWSLQDDLGEGQYRVLTNNSNGDIIVWQNWTLWTNNTQFSIPINNSVPGTYFYNIEYYDNQGQLGIPDTVIVTIMNMNPTSNHPNNITTSATGTETIGWVLMDDFGGGQYRIWANNTSGDYYVWRSWRTWTNNTPLNVPINRDTPGFFNFTIEYYDMYGLFGDFDTVVVEIINNIPTSNHPNIIISTLTGNETIGWVLTDDFGGGQYRVWANNTSGDFYVWQDWQLWTDRYVSLNIPINRTSLGIFNYTIEYYDANNLYGISDTVIVIISTGRSKTIPLYHYYFVFIVCTLIPLILIVKRKILKNNRL